MYRLCLCAAMSSGSCVGTSRAATDARCLYPYATNAAYLIPVLVLDGSAHSFYLRSQASLSPLLHAAASPPVSLLPTASSAPHPQGQQAADGSAPAPASASAPTSHSDEPLWWLPPTLPAVTLRLLALDASIIYRQGAPTGRDCLAGYKYTMRPAPLEAQPTTGAATAAVDAPPMPAATAALPVAGGGGAVVLSNSLSQFGRVLPQSRLVPTLPAEVMAIKARDFELPLAEMRESVAEADKQGLLHVAPSGKGDKDKGAKAKAGAAAGKSTAGGAGGGSKSKGSKSVVVVSGVPRAQPPGVAKAKAAAAKAKSGGSKSKKGGGGGGGSKKAKKEAPPPEEGDDGDEWITGGLRMAFETWHVGVCFAPTTKKVFRGQFKNIRPASVYVQVTCGPRSRRWDALFTEPAFVPFALSECAHAASGPLPASCRNPVRQTQRHIRIATSIHILSAPSALPSSQHPPNPLHSIASDSTPLRPLAPCFRSCHFVGYTPAPVPCFPQAPWATPCFWAMTTTSTGWRTWAARTRTRGRGTTATTRTTS